MNKLLVLLALILVACSGGNDAPSTATDSAAPDTRLPVVIEWGRSNGSGHGLVAELTAEERLPDSRWLVWEAMAAPWNKYPTAWSVGGPQPRTKSLTKLSEFGPELFTGRGIADSGRRVAVLKYAHGGLSLGQYWVPSLGLEYPLALDVTRKALAALGEEHRVTAFVFICSEGTTTPEAVAAWQSNMDELIGAVRTDLDVPGARFIYPRFSSNQYQGDLKVEFRAEQDAYAASRSNTTMIDTDSFPVIDDDPVGYPQGNIHFNTIGTRELGLAIARVAAPL